MALPFDALAEARRNWERHGWGAADAMVAATSIARAHQILVGRVDAALAPHGLTFSRFEALALLHFSRRGMLPMGKVGARLQVHPTSVTNTISRLEAQGLVRRLPGEADRRSVLAAITPEGRDRLRAAAEALTAAEIGLPGLAPEELRRIHAALAPVRRGAGDVVATPPDDGGPAA
jgi:DNA-binding MarR family transcriptional regulator